MSFRRARRLLGFAFSAALASSNALAAQRVATQAASEAATPHAFQTPRSAAAIAAQCRTLLADLNKAEAQLARGGEAPGTSLLAALDAMTRRTEDTMGPLGVLVAVSPRKAIRDAAEACDRDYQAYSSRFWQNAAVYARIKQVRPADDIDRRYWRDTIDNFEDAGVALAPARQRRVRELNDELTALTQHRRELVDLEVLRAEKARHLNQPLGQTVLARWDAAFYSECVARTTDAVDQEQFRRYFLTEASLRTAFAADRLSPAVGRRYRETVLESGGQVAPGELMQRFLGRPADSRAFFEALSQ